MELVESDIFWSSLKEHDFKVSTGSLTFDIFLDGGFGPGVVRFGGAPSHGKTMQCLTWAAYWLEHWKGKGRVVYYDTEGRLTLAKLGNSKLVKFLENADTTKHFVIRRDNVYETIGDQIVKMVRDNKEDLKYFIVFDSLDMMRSIHDIDKGLEENNKVGSAATTSNNLMRIIGPDLFAHGHHFHILSQIRSNIQTGNPHAKQTKMSGGWALLHSSNLTGMIKSLYTDLYIFENPEATKIEDKGKRIGHYCVIEFSKTPNDKDNETIRIPIRHNHGVWVEREVVDLLFQYGFIMKKASWNKFDPSFYAEMMKNVPDCGLSESVQGAASLYGAFEKNPKLVVFVESYLRKILLP